MTERICLILLFNLVYFLKTLGYGYTSDDLVALKTPVPFRNKLEKWFLQLRGSLKINQQEDHFITIVIHALVCVGIYLAFGASDISFLAAFLFSVNPINNQGSVWMSGRGYVLAALFNLWSIALPVLSPAFMLCSTYYNLGYVAPLILSGSGVSWILLYMPFIWAYRFRKFRNDVSRKAKGEMFVEDRKIGPQKIIVAVKTFGFYFSHAIIPFKTTFYHSFLQSMAGSGKDKAYTIKDRFFWVGLASIAGIIWYWATHSWNLVSFGLLWWCIGIAPFLNFVRLSQEIAERYAYLPCVGLMYVIAAATSSYPAVAWGFFAMYATKMWFYMDAYQDDYYLAETACLNSPQSWFAWHVRAMKRWEVQSFREAMIFWVMARSISPNEFKILFNLATSLALLNKKEEAFEHLAMAEANIPAGQEEEVKKIFEDFRNGKCSVLL